jgi:hypothetical protein
MAFRLAPAFPSDMMQQGKAYGITNLTFRGSRHDVEYQVTGESTLQVKLTSRSESGNLSVQVKDSTGKSLAAHKQSRGEAVVRFAVKNGDVYTIFLA